MDNCALTGEALFDTPTLCPNLSSIIDLVTGMLACSSVATDLQLRYETTTENAIAKSMGKVEGLFSDGALCSLNKAINEIVILVSIRMRDEYRKICSELIKSITHIITTEFSKGNYSFDTLVYQLENLRESVNYYESALAKRESVIDALKSQIAASEQRTQKAVAEERATRMNFLNQRALLYARRTLLFRVWSAWKSSLESSWKQRVHRRLQLESQQMCVRLAQDYEIKLADLRERLRSAEERCALAEASHVRSQETMKSALMRGVCALNMETLSVVQPSDFVRNAHSLGLYKGASRHECDGTDDVSTMKVKPESIDVHNLPGRMSRSFATTRVTFDLPEPVQSATRPCQDASLIRPNQNRLFRAHTVHYGIPVSSAAYSSASLAAIRIQRHDRSDQIPNKSVTLSRESSLFNLQSPIRRGSLRREI